MKKIDLSRIIAEVRGIEMIVAGLGNQLDNDKTDTLNPGAMRDALLGVELYLERIAEDLGDLDMQIQ